MTVWCVRSALLGAVLAVVVQGLFPSAADAQLVREGAYTGLRLTGGQSSVDDVSATGLTGNLVENNTEDPTAAAGWLVGYRFGDLPLRLEGEVSHRFRMDFDTRDDAGNVTGFENNLSTTVALINAAWEVRTDSSWTPFVGGSIGWARNQSDVERIDLGTGVASTTQSATNSLALGVMAGVDYELSRHWGTELAYRYLNMGEVETGRLSGEEEIKADSYVSHDLMWSLLYRF